MTKEKNEWDIVAKIMMFATLALLITYILAGVPVRAEEESEQNETETQETEEQGETEESDEKEISVQLEEIRTQTEKISNEIELQKVDTAKIKAQAEEIENIKAQLEEVKLAAQSPTNAAGLFYNPYLKNGVIPLQDDVKKYYYRLTIAGNSTDEINGTYIIVSNSPNLSTINSEKYDELNPTALQEVWGVTGLYADNLKRLQPICGCKIGAVNNVTGETIETEKDAIELMENRENWGWPVNLNSYDVLCNMQERDSFGNGQNIASIIVTPYGSKNTEIQEEEPYTTMLSVKYNGQNKSIYRRRKDESDTYKLEKIEYKPNEKEWQTQDLYIPVMVIMAASIIMIFRRRH